MSTDLTAQLAATAELVAARAADGDEVATPRVVDHFLTVSKRRAGALRTELEQAGFRVETRGGLFRTRLECERENAVDAATAEAFTREIVGIANRHDADYDGWGALSVGGEQGVWQEPEDGIELPDVPLDAETGRLRDCYAGRLTDDGCPPDLARQLARNVTLELSTDTWHITDGVAGSGVIAPYSPSAATAEVEEFADGLIEDNRRRRRPKWVSRS